MAEPSFVVVLHQADGSVEYAAFAGHGEARSYGRARAAELALVEGRDRVDLVEVRGAEVLTVETLTGPFVGELPEEPAADDDVPPPQAFGEGEWPPDEVRLRVEVIVAADEDGANRRALETELISWFGDGWKVRTEQRSERLELDVTVARGRDFDDESFACALDELGCVEWLAVGDAVADG